MLNIQETQSLKLAQRVWNGTAQIVQVQIQAHQICQIPQLVGNFPTYVVTVQFPVNETY